MQKQRHSLLVLMSQGGNVVRDFRALTFISALPNTSKPNVVFADLNGEEEYHAVRRYCEGQAINYIPLGFDSNRDSALDIASYLAKASLKNPVYVCRFDHTPDIQILSDVRVNTKMVEI